MSSYLLYPPSAVVVRQGDRCYQGAPARNQSAQADFAPFVAAERTQFAINRPKPLSGRRMMPAHLFPQPSGQTPWRTAILSLVPLAFAGPLAVIHSYHPWWDPQELPWISSAFLIVAPFSLCAGFILGALKKFPRWSYPYAIYVVILITFLATYLVNGTPWDINHEGYILLVLLPSLIGILGALAHLRLPSAPWRTAVLILGALAGVPLTMFTLYGSWMELLKPAGFVLAVWGVLVGLLLAPILAGLFARSEPFS